MRLYGTTKSYHSLTYANKWCGFTSFIMLFVLNDFDLLNFYDFSLSLEDHFEYSFVMWITKQVTFLKKNNTESGIFSCFCFRELENWLYFSFLGSLLSACWYLLANMDPPPFLMSIYLLQGHLEASSKHQEFDCIDRCNSLRPLY